MTIPNEPEGNVEAIKSELRSLVGQIESAKSGREQINADISAAVERAEQLGVSRHALRLAMRYAKMDEDQRRGFDVAYQLTREAIGLPMQTDIEEWLRDRNEDRENADADAQAA